MRDAWSSKKGKGVQRPRQKCDTATRWCDNYCKGEVKNERAQYSHILAPWMNGTIDDGPIGGMISPSCVPSHGYIAWMTLVMVPFCF